MNPKTVSTVYLNLGVDKSLSQHKLITPLRGLCYLFLHPMGCAPSLLYAAPSGLIENNRNSRVSPQEDSAYRLTIFPESCWRRDSVKYGEAKGIHDRVAVTHL